MLRVMIDLCRAQLAEARRGSDEARAILDDAPDEALERIWNVQRLWLLRDAGTSDELRAHASRELFKLPGGQGQGAGAATFMLMMRACALSWAGDVDGARAIFRTLPNDPTIARRFAPMLVLFANALEMEASTEMLRGIVEGLDTTMGDRRWFGWGAMLSYEGRVEHALGLVHTALGDTDRGLALLREASAQNALHGFALAALRARFDEARVARDRATMEQVREQARRVGASRIAERATTWLEAQAAVAVPDAPQRIHLQRDGDVWRVLFHQAGGSGGRAVALKDSRGLLMLARLIESPGVEISALDLEGADIVDAGGFGAALDDDAKRAYRDRLRELASAIDDAEAAHDLGRAERLRDERDALEREVARAVGKGGRDRKLGAASERARINVQRRLKDAIARIREADPAAGAHLESAVKTGTSCVYRPR